MSIKKAQAQLAKLEAAHEQLEAGLLERQHSLEAQRASLGERVAEGADLSEAAAAIAHEQREVEALQAAIEHSAPQLEDARRAVGEALLAGAKDDMLEAAGQFDKIRASANGLLAPVGDEFDKLQEQIERVAAAGQVVRQYGDLGDKARYDGALRGLRSKLKNAQAAAAALGEFFS